MNILTPDFFTQNRAALRTKHQSDLPIVIAANGLLQRTADSTYPFTQESNFWYLAGLDTPDLVLVIGINSDYLIAPGRSEIRAFFDGANDDIKWAKRSGVREIYDTIEGWKKLKSEIQSKELRTVGILLPDRIYDSNHGFYANPAKYRLQQKLRRIEPSIQLVNVRQSLAEARAVKQEVEIHCLERAINITKQTLGELNDLRRLLSFQHEYELEAHIAAGFRSRGATGHAFTPIVASAKNATTLHYIANTDVLRRDEFVVLDVGAEVEHYAADITRTVMYGHPSPRHTAVYAAVEKAQEYAVSLIRPGVKFSEYERLVEMRIGEELESLGLVNPVADRSEIRRYFPHATSHFLGLDVHDVGNYGIIQEGMVLTCEPGIYIPEEGIGVRIEDDLLVTSNGARVL